MGGSGNSSPGSGYASADKTLMKGKTLSVERLTNSPVSEIVVLSASTDGKGNLTLNYANPTGYRKQNSKTTYAQYDLQHGITNAGLNGKYTDMQSHNINWDKVNSVSGKTFEAKGLIRSKGLKWDGNKKRWSKS